ncbi:MAG: sulfite exporter TauE/SafE family protein, partial [Rhodospirillaceae bacterium]|nr:sulfite exporter TauE/SafE family protein [Rhodospirillaceae bacterium]
ANVTVLQSVNNYAVDVVLATLLLFGAVIGAQFGARAGAKLGGEQLRILLALMVIGVCVKIGLDLTLEPSDLYTIVKAGGH